jgi:hypothetical protein
MELRQGWGARIFSSSGERQRQVLRFAQDDIFMDEDMLKQ